MSILRRIGNAAARFMYGRNGMDQLNRMLFWVYLVVFLVQAVLASLLRSSLLAIVCDILLWVLMILIFFRMFSKNLPKRRAENQKWVNWWWSVKSRHADKEHRYFTCKNCKAICRVPVGKGRIIITCPKCGAEIKAKT